MVWLVWGSKCTIDMCIAALCFLIHWQIVETHNHPDEADHSHGLSFSRLLPSTRNCQAHTCTNWTILCQRLQLMS